jgi:hypothetical protein
VRVHCLLLHRQTLQIIHRKRRVMFMYGRSNYPGCPSLMRGCWILTINLRRQVFLNHNGYSQWLRVVIGFHATFVYICFET